MDAFRLLPIATIHSVWDNEEPTWMSDAGTMTQTGSYHDIASKQFIVYLRTAANTNNYKLRLYANKYKPYYPRTTIRDTDNLALVLGHTHVMNQMTGLKISILLQNIRTTYYIRCLRDISVLLRGHLRQNVVASGMGRIYPNDFILQFNAAAASADFNGIPTVVNINNVSTLPTVAQMAGGRRKRRNRTRKKKHTRRLRR